MTDTPRTDAEILRVPSCFEGIDHHVVLADFARQLERENAELQEALEGIVEANGGLAMMPVSIVKAQNPALAFARALATTAKEFSHE